jgi:hypothetical protein
MATAIRLLALYVGCGIAVLQAFLFMIARFYQLKSGNRTRYGLFLVSMTLVLAGDMLYCWRGPMMLGDMAADLLLLCGGCVLLGNGFLLLRAMTQGR